MMCPVCKRDLAPTLSICLTCGAMINDTVREELETKISRGDLAVSNSGRLTAKSATVTEPPSNTKATESQPSLPNMSQPTMTTPEWATPETTAPQPEVTQPTPPRQAASKATPAPPPAPQQQKPIGARFETKDLHAKKTSPTLVEFQTKKATVPEWRLQLQNSVRQKVGGNRRDDAAPEATQQKTRATSGANALKVEFVEDEEPRHQNPRVANALKRIEESRRAFSNQPMPEQSVRVGKANATPRNYPFNVVAKSEQPQRPQPKATVNPSPKPMLVSPLKIEKKGFDTNKLPPLPAPSPKPSRRFIPAPEAPTAKTQAENVKAEETIIDDISLELEPETDEIEDLAPLSMRFNAGLFDMIIGLFASLILLSPFIVSGGTWVSPSGFLTIAATASIVMFLYLTISLSFFGRTFGMRLFSLELVDVEENEYPTMHQAAVSSAVYLLSIAFGGIGFLPIFFNEERRAAHDILSGTILVREY